MKLFKISIQIIFMFVSAMLISIIPENLELFGDWTCSGSGTFVAPTYHYVDGHFQRCNYAQFGYHDAIRHWGYRHWLFCIMGLCLFVVQIFKLGETIESENA